MPEANIKDFNKIIFMVRCAHAHRDEALLDKQFPLTETGQRQLLQMTKNVAPYIEIVHKSKKNWRLLHSPARRAVQTSEGIEPLLPPCPQHAYPQLHDCLAQTILDILSDQDEEVEVAMVVGHNPSLSELASLGSRGNWVALGHGDIAIFGAESFVDPSTYQLIVHLKALFG